MTTIPPSPKISALACREAADSKRHIRSCHVDLGELHSSPRVRHGERNDRRRLMPFRKD